MDKREHIHRRWSTCLKSDVECSVTKEDILSFLFIVSGNSRSDFDDVKSVKHHDLPDVLEDFVMYKGRDVSIREESRYL